MGGEPMQLLGDSGLLGTGLLLMAAGMAVSMAHQLLPKVLAWLPRTFSTSIRVRN